MRAALVSIFVALALPARASELPRRSGMYAPSGAALAMLSSAVDVRVRGPIVEATVHQTFRNDSDAPTEATYIFPLPDDAAVSAMAIATGTRTIHAAIATRDEARRRYEAAISAGVGAALLDEERPDVFTQAVAAIPAHGKVEVTLRFDTTARYADGTWQLVLPLVVAPRYVPGAASGRPTTGSGRAPDTDRAPDASRVTPGGGPDEGGPTAVALAFADPVLGVQSPTHALARTAHGWSLTDPHSDHDAIVRWRARDATRAWLERDGRAGYAAVLVTAPPAAKRTAALRCLLVVDRAATTRGDADAVAHPLVGALLADLAGADRAAVAGSDAIAWGAPADVARALETRWATPAGPFDLTRVLAALHANARDAVVLVTDGLVADDRAALAAARAVDAPIHVIGVGPAPNRSLLEGIARATGGTVRFAAPDDDLAALARDVLADAASPPPTLAVSWGALRATDVVPAELPRLGAGQAVLVLARVARTEPANARVAGDVLAFAPIDPPPPAAGATTPLGPLARRWARDELDALVFDHTGDAAAIREHALRYGLVSPETSMIAVGDEVVAPGGVAHTRAVPVSVPAGMRWQAVRHELEVEPPATTFKQQANADTGGDDDGDAASDDAADGSKRQVAAREQDAAPQAGPEIVQDEALAVIGAEGGSVRRGLHVALGLGGGLAYAHGTASGLAAASARLELALGRGPRPGIAGALWLVGGDVQGDALATVSADATHRLAFELGLGVHLGGGVGPALELALRTPLVLPHLSAVLSYDGALLHGSGEHAAALGLEASW